MKDKQSSKYSQIPGRSMPAVVLPSGPILDEEVHLLGTLVELMLPKRDPVAITYPLRLFGFLKHLRYIIRTHCHLGANTS